MNKDLIKNELKSMLSKAYGDYKSVAVVITNNDNKYFGVSIDIDGEPGYTPAITNAICSAVSEGERTFKCVYVLFEEFSDLCYDKMADFETRCLLKEFNVDKFILFNNAGEEIIKCC